MVKLPAFELLQVNLQSLKHLTARTNLGTQEFRENKQNKLWVSHGTGVSKFQPYCLTLKILFKQEGNSKTNPHINMDGFYLTITQHIFISNFSDIIIMSTQLNHQVVERLHLTLHIYIV